MTKSRLSKGLSRLFVCLSLTGCANTYPLGPKWAPLTSVEEAPGKLVQPHMITTVDNTCYVESIQAWLADYPPGSIGQEALLRHERLHSRRQHAYPEGVAAWLAKYLADRAFRWEEEKLGWQAEISYHVNHGDQVKADAIAKILNENYGVVGGRMVSFDEAIKWVQSVAANPLPDEN